MRFVAISDTHGQHKKLQLPPADAIIHAGDVSRKGSEEEILDFLKWFSGLEYRYKIFIAGNHDFYFERESKENIEKIIPQDVIYLNDSDIVIEGIRIWGSPITPWFFDWAFNRNRGADISKHWALIPSGTEIIVTHGPVYGILDKTIYKESVGCEDLLKKIYEIKPKFHLCGHIHEAYGTVVQDGINFINASVLDQRYKLKHEPVIFEMNP